MVRAALEFTPPNPSARENEIKKAFGHLNYGNSFFLSFAGIDVDERPQMIKGRLLPRPKIVFNGASRSLVCYPLWNIGTETYQAGIECPARSMGCNVTEIG